MGGLDVTIVKDIVVVLVPMILSLSVHEFAHAWSAHKLGDDTAAAQGRLTLNPIAHIDVLGTIVFPVLSIIGGAATGGAVPFFGWAKPVPVSPYRFRRTVSMRTGMILTAIAGPLSNILIAFLTCGVWLFFYSKIGGVEGELAARGSFSIALFLNVVFQLNLTLAVFNLLPVPPLDGSRLLPLEWQERLARYQFVVFVVLIMAVNRFGAILDIPTQALARGILTFWSLFF